jgi:hypothetical protein
MKLEPFVEAAGLPITFICGGLGYALAVASAASIARVSALMRQMMNSAGLLVARSTRTMSVPAKTTVGVLRASDTSTKKAFAGALERKAPLFRLRQKEGRDGAPHLRAEPRCSPRAERTLERSFNQLNE